MNPTEKCLPLGPDSSMKVSANFIHFYLLKMPYFYSVWCGPPSRWPSFEHSSTKMGSLDIDPVYSTLCPSITSTCSTSKFHPNMFQYSVGGAVIPNAITYGQDRMSSGECNSHCLLRETSCELPSRHLHGTLCELLSRCLLCETLCESLVTYRNLTSVQQPLPSS